MQRVTVADSPAGIGHNVTRPITNNNIAKSWPMYNEWNCAEGFNLIWNLPQLDQILKVGCALQTYYLEYEGMEDEQYGETDIADEQTCMNLPTYCNNLSF